MKAAGNFLQVFIGLCQARSDVCELLFESIELVWHDRLGHSGIERKCNQLLLRSIVEVAFQTAPGVVCGRHNPRA